MTSEQDVKYENASAFAVTHCNKGGQFGGDRVSCKHCGKVGYEEATVSSCLDTLPAGTQEANTVVKGGAGGLVAKVGTVVAVDVEATQPSKQILSSKRPRPSRLI